MKSSTITANGNLVASYNNIDGSSQTVTSVLKFYHATEVSNGSYSGGKNRKTPNPFSFHIVKAGWGSLSDKVISVYRGRKSYTTRSGPDLPPNYNIVTPSFIQFDWPKLQNAAMAKIYDQLKGNNNLIVDLAEGGQTAKMVKNVLHLKKFISTFLSEVIKHRKFKRIPKGPTQNQRRLDYVTEKWLESRYGWQPFVYSIYDAADNLNRQCKNRVIWIKGRSGCVNNQKFMPENVINGIRKQVCDYQSSYRLEYGFLFNMPGGPSVSDWTSLNPLGIAYELMTLSFVIDWVIDIGGYLSLWENNVLFSKYFIMGYETRTYRESYTFKSSYHSLDPFVYYPNGVDLIKGFQQDTLTSSYCVRVGKDRSRIASLPTPSHPTVKVRFGSLHQLDSMALLHQLVSRKVR